MRFVVHGGSKLMEISEYPQNLKTFLDKYGRGYLDYSTTSSLYKTVKDMGELVDVSKNKKRKTPPSWAVKIERNKPLVFVKNKDNLQVDICCDIQGKGNVVTKQNIELRVWSLNQQMSYRDEVDSLALKDELEIVNWKRVISRFHFDLKTTDTTKPEPICHLQIGGDSGSCLSEGSVSIKENCWHPSQLSIPRFFHVPFDIILICEFILVNFFPNESLDTRKKPEWVQLVKKSEEFFCKEYIKKCFDSLNDSKQTMLGNLAPDPKK